MTDPAGLTDGAVLWNGTSYATVVPSADTGGTMCILDTVTPGGSGPPRHVHATEDEAFVVMTGEVDFWVAGQTVRKGPGEGAFVQRGTEHTFRVVGDQPSRHLLILTPGGFEGFFAEMAKGGFRIPQDMAAVIEGAARYGMMFTGPPL